MYHFKRFYIFTFLFFTFCNQNAFCANEEFFSLEKLPTDIQKKITDMCSLKDLHNLNKTNKSCYELSLKKIIDHEIQSIDQINRFSKKHLEFLLMIKTPLKKQILEKIHENDKQNLLNIIKKRTDLKANHTFFALIFSRYMTNIKSPRNNAANAVASIDYSRAPFQFSRADNYKILSDAYHSSKQSSYYFANKVIEYICINISEVTTRHIQDSKNSIFQSDNHLRTRHPSRQIIWEDLDRTLQETLSILKISDPIEMTEATSDLSEIISMILILKNNQFNFEKAFDIAYEKIKGLDLDMTIEDCEQIIANVFHEYEFAANEFITEFLEYLIDNKETIISLIK